MLKIKQLNVAIEGKDITRLPVDERARLGIGISFQRLPEVRGES